jgi:pyrroline-5-carboxylate reductase
MKTAILGFGTMGQMFARLVMRNLPPEDNLTIANRTVSRMDDFAREYAREYPRVTTTGDFAEACEGADIAILAVSPMAAKEVLAMIAPSLKGSCILVSFVADLSISNIGKYFSGKIIRLVPTITSYVDRGVTIASIGGTATKTDLDRVRSLVSPSLYCTVVADADINDYSIITSCGPGIVSSILGELAAAYERGAQLGAKLDGDAVAHMLTETVAAVCEYARVTGKPFELILSEVATKGGITESGASVIKEKSGEVFAEMAAAMKNKHTTRRAKIDTMFENNRA